VRTIVQRIDAFQSIISWLNVNPVLHAAFVGRADKTRLYGLLVSDDVFKDFTVRLKFKCLSGDSRFYIRTIIKKPEKAHGLQVQVGQDSP